MSVVSVRVEFPTAQPTTTAHAVLTAALEHAPTAQAWTVHDPRRPHGVNCVAVTLNAAATMTAANLAALVRALEPHGRVRYGILDTSGGAMLAV